MCDFIKLLEVVSINLAQLTETLYFIFGKSWDSNSRFPTYSL